jgi:hypothetical protein
VQYAEPAHPAAEEASGEAALAGIAAGKPEAAEGIALADIAGKDIVAGVGGTVAGVEDIAVVVDTAVVADTVAGPERSEAWKLAPIRPIKLLSV